MRVYFLALTVYFLHGMDEIIKIAVGKILFLQNHLKNPS